MLVQRKQVQVTQVVQSNDDSELGIESPWLETYGESLTDLDGMQRYLDALGQVVLLKARTHRR